MITFSQLGKHGRLGNQLFQIAAVLGMAKKYGRIPVLPQWNYSKYFKGKWLNETVLKPTQVKEVAFHYTPEYYDSLDWNQHIDLFGYFQSEKYFLDARIEVQEKFEFDSAFEKSVSKKYEKALDKDCIAISIRRGDYVGNKNYAQLPITWYFSALELYFPNWRTENNIVIFSDDIEYCRVHFGCLPNVYFAENKFNNTDKKKYFQENPYAIEQLCLMAMCQHFIIANSSFSWWGAWLGEKENTIVVRPKEHLAGPLAANNDTKDYYPERWKCFSGSKINLMDVTFMVPVHYDHNDRKQNLDLNVCMLQRDFDTNIIVHEQGTDKFSYFKKHCEYAKSPYNIFHRTAMLNDMAMDSETPIIFNWDADVFLSPIQVLECIRAIRLGADLVYPYDGRFARVNRQQWFKKLEPGLDVGIFGNVTFPGMLLSDKKSVGGAMVFSKEAYFKAGGENEYFIAYGPEDVEREVRFTRLGYNVQRIKGPLYHMDHWKGPNSKCSGNPYDKQNHDELEKIYSLTRTQLADYVNTWPWRLNFYNL